MIARLKTTALYFLILAGGLGVGLAIAKLPKLLEKRYQQGDYSAYFSTSNVKVVIYGTSTCPFCAKARDHLTHKKIAFSDFNVDKSEIANEQFKTFKGTVVPVIIIGDRLITGFQPDVIDEALRAAVH
ncbi:glutaredoxin family protein [Burkholderia sp. LMU1-1-1.1]|uniref:glutaredoxin family protein n=1 Tax=Burkholderia sp. LMU1-1-1.1 TaxID=3135266 RepID=UPI00341434C4